MGQNNNQSRRSLPANAQDRKERPMARGLLDYFPDALAAIANVSHVGNEQHNPGEEMHWAREKSKDHPDCIIRHLVERGTMDDDGLSHSAKMAWRALALLQIEIEQRGNSTAGYSTLPAANSQTPRSRPSGSHSDIGLSPQQVETSEPIYFKRVYIAGPMRGVKDFNFPAFDTARDLANKNGWDPISPADIDRESGVHENTDIAEVDTHKAARVFAQRDCNAIIDLLAEYGDAIAMLPGWTKSTGARAEFFLASWVGLQVLNAVTMEPFTVQEQKIMWDGPGAGPGLGELKAAGLRIISKGE